MAQLSDRSDRHYQSHMRVGSHLAAYQAMLGGSHSPLMSRHPTCGDRCTEWLHGVLSAPCSTEAKHGSVDVTEQAWTAVGRLRDGLTDAGWYDHPQALADACTASTCPISSRLPWADGSHAYGPRQVQETISVRQRGGGVGSSEASVLRAKSSGCTGIIEGVALVEGGARKERLEFPGGAFQGQPPPDPPQALLLGRRVAWRSGWEPL